MTFKLLYNYDLEQAYVHGPLVAMSDWLVFQVIEFRAWRRGTPRWLLLERIARVRIARRRNAVGIGISILDEVPMYLLRCAAYCW